ncbi:HNH endonuclease signature motif containing protein [Nocardioides sp.]|uniref:HNH endonuclease signature motif containing protein n=1 Tax=Nocardioides sp. TaxID=35761 RepID=UPI0025D3F8A4|nr:HNH endonuclease signature motif containing protein [Nocardioides sp.]
MQQLALEEMSEDQVLDFAGACADTVWRAEADLLRAAYQWSVIHTADRLDSHWAGVHGSERVRRLGGPGVPEVTEFAAAELGARIGRSPYAAARLIADAQDLHHRHPQLWARVEAGEVRASYARDVVSKTRDLQPEEAAYVDAAVVESADGRIPWSRFEALVEAKVAQAAPELAREAEERAAKATFAKKCRGEAHGMGSYLVHADVATIDAIEAAVAMRAEQVAESCPDDPDLATEDQRRVHAFLLMVTGATDDTDIADLLPRVELFVHTYAGPDAEDVARVEGHGPVTHAWVRDLLGPKARFTIRPVLDLAGQAPVDAWEIPDRHRQAVHLMTPADTFPYASSTSRSMDIDHTKPHAQGGISGIGNYGPTTRRHHRIKTHAIWQIRQPFPGIYVWRDPHGAHYLVDHTGTRRIPSTPHAAQHPDPPQKPLVLDVWYPPFDIQLDPDYPHVA